MLNPFSQAQFFISCADLNQLPRDHQPEVAFVGRSNAGKSSALNTLAGRKSLARVSKTPGRTQLINLFSLPTEQRLVDLPGYGYANVPESIRRNWGKLVGGYVERRDNLTAIILIMDIRHPLTSDDQKILKWVEVSGRACHILLTKSDKLAFGAAKKQLQKVEGHLANHPSQISVQLFSSLKKTGVEQARTRVLELLNEQQNC